MHPKPQPGVRSTRSSPSTSWSTSKIPCATLGAVREGLRPGGVLALWVPAYEALFSNVDRQQGQLRRYRLSTLATQLDDAGFEIVELRYAHGPGAVAWYLHATVRRRDADRLAPGRPLRPCRRPAGPPLGEPSPTPLRSVRPLHRPPPRRGSGMSLGASVDRLRREVRDHPATALTVVAILTVAFGVRAAAVLATRDYQPLTDALNFHHIAASVSDGNGFGESMVPPAVGPTAYRAPLYPIVLAGIYEVLGIATTKARLVQALIGAGTVGLVGVVAVQLWDRRVALIAMAIAAVYPPLVIIPTSLQWEVVFVPLLLAVVAAALAYRRAPSLRSAAAVGGLIGLLTLSRETGAAMLLPAGLLMTVAAGVRGRRALAALAAAGLTAVAVVVPWTLRNAAQLDAFVPVSTSGGYTLAGMYSDAAAHRRGSPGQWTLPSDDPRLLRVLQADSHLTEVEMDSRLRREALDYLGDHPSYLGTLAYWNTIRMFDLRGPPRRAVHLAVLPVQPGPGSPRGVRLLRRGRARRRGGLHARRLGQCRGRCGWCRSSST